MLAPRLAPGRGTAPRGLFHSRATARDSVLFCQCFVMASALFVCFVFWGYPLFVRSSMTRVVPDPAISASFRFLLFLVSSIGGFLIVSSGDSAVAGELGLVLGFRPWAV